MCFEAALLVPCRVGFISSLPSSHRSPASGHTCACPQLEAAKSEAAQAKAKGEEAAAAAKFLEKEIKEFDKDRCAWHQGLGFVY